VRLSLGPDTPGEQVDRAAAALAAAWRKVAGR
jgi:cysteine sulfinate desulfinase/cysteine desulfurase-like protein